MSAELTAALKTLLTTTAMPAYVGDVPAKPPADTTGRVKPYSVIWPSAGYLPDYARTAGGTDAEDSGLEWPVQVTVAAGDPAWCLQAAASVRARMAGAVLVAGAGPLREESASPAMQKDPDVQPPRWFVPLLWRCATP